LAANGKQTILVVEDEEQVRTLLAKLLEKNDYDVATAADGLDAMKFLEGDKPDLMLVDVMMPRLDGFSLVKAVRFKPDCRHIPIIFLTAKTDARSMIEGINVGAKFFLTKPFQIGDVLAKIRKALEHAPA
jgi:DNA-binding response OmpR family regulator